MYIYTHIYILRIVVNKVTHAITSFVGLNHISLLTEPWNSYQFRKALLYTEAHLEETKETCSHSVPQVNFFFYASLSGSTWQRTIRFAIFHRCTYVQQKSKFRPKTSAVSETPGLFFFTVLYQFYLITSLAMYIKLN